MRTTIRELQTRLDLDEQGLRDLLDPGRLDNQCVDPEVLNMVRAAFIAAARDVGHNAPESGAKRTTRDLRNNYVESAQKLRTRELLAQSDQNDWRKPPSTRH
jgi:hypothetical protein